MLLDQCYCSLTDALIKNWAQCGLDAYFDSSVIIEDEENACPIGPYAVIEEIGVGGVPFDQNCESITDEVTYTITLHCASEKNNAENFGKRLRSIFNTKFKNVATDCGDIQKIEANRPNLRRIGSQFMMRIQFNVRFVTGKAF